MKNKPTEEENRLFEELTGGNAGNLFLMVVELNGKETTCIFAYENIEGEDKVLFSPVALLVNDEIGKQIVLPEDFDQLTLPDFDDENDEEDSPEYPLNLN